jgi:hypothetical protein
MHLTGYKTSTAINMNANMFFILRFLFLFLSIIWYYFTTVSVSYNKKQLDALISQKYPWHETLHVSHSSFVHHQEFFTVNTAMVYVIEFCR